MVARLQRHQHSAPDNYFKLIFNSIGILIHATWTASYKLE